MALSEEWAVAHKFASHGEAAEQQEGFQSGRAELVQEHRVFFVPVIRVESVQVHDVEVEEISQGQWRHEEAGKVKCCSVQWAGTAAPQHKPARTMTEVCGKQTS